MGHSQRRRSLGAVLAAAMAVLVVAPAGASPSPTATAARAPRSRRAQTPVRSSSAASTRPTAQRRRRGHARPLDPRPRAGVARELDRRRGPGRGRRRRATLGRAPTLPTGFADVEAIGDLSEATAVAFAPDGTAFIALKTGVIKSFDYNAGTGQFEPNATSTTFADLTRQVNNYWDRGLTGIAVDPQFGTAGHNYVYVNYAYNRDPRDNPETVVPRWGDPASAVRRVPDPAEAAVGPPAITGCLVTVRITRLTAVQASDGWVMRPDSELPLLMGSLPAVRQPRLRRRGLRPGRLALRLGRRRRELRQRGLRPGRQPLPRRPGQARVARCAARTSARTGDAAGLRRLDRPDERRQRQRTRRQRRHGQADWSPTASATRGG